MNLVYLHRHKNGGGAIGETHDGAQASADIMDEARSLLAAMLSIADSERAPRMRPAAKTTRRVSMSPAAVIASSLGGSSLGPMMRSQRTPRPADILAHALRRPSKPQGMREMPSGEAFWAMWNAHRDFLYRRCLRLLGGNHADAEDALGDAMVKAAQAFRSGDIRSERAWLLRLAHNACMDQYRSHRRQTRLVDEMGSDTVESVAAIVPTGTRSPEEHLGAAHMLRDLRRGIAALPETLSLPLLMHFQERSDDEIAAALNVTKDVVRKRRQIARERLRQALPER